MNVTLPLEIITIPTEVIRYDYKFTLYIGMICLLFIFFNRITKRRCNIMKQKFNEVIDMDELKRQTMDILEMLEKDMVERIKHAEESGEGIDLMSRNAKVMELLRKLDNAFIEAKQRTANKTKKGWFG